MSPNPTIHPCQCFFPVRYGIFFLIGKMFHGGAWQSVVLFSHFLQHGQGQCGRGHVDGVHGVVEVNPEAFPGRSGSGR